MQRVFDVENEKDMADLWDILPNHINKIKGDSNRTFTLSLYNSNMCCYNLAYNIFNINWNGKTEIHRPIPEATEADIGKLCKFWYRDDKDMVFGILESIDDIDDEDCGFAKFYCMKNGHDFYHCRRLTKQEIEELC